MNGEKEVFGNKVRTTQDSAALKWTREWKGKADVLTIKFVDDGVKISDLNLAAIILNCVDGAECYQAVPGDRQHRFLFYIKGDPEKIKEFVELFMTGRAKDVMVNKLTKFTTTIGTLKMLIDRAKISVTDKQ